MKLYALQHVPFEGLAGIEEWAALNKYEITTVKFFNNDTLPDIEDTDFLVILGGPMSVLDEKEFPWLIREKEFILKAIKAGKKVLGICLGAQLIAEVLGGKITKNKHREIGWFKVKTTENTIQSRIFKDIENEFICFHWHGETFSIPKDATHLAYSEACTNQAFEYGNNVLALQFHLEYTKESINDMLKNCSDELTDAPFIQSETTILQGLNHIEPTRNLLYRLLNNLNKKNETF